MPHRTGLAQPSIAEGSAQYRDRHAEPESCLASLCPDAFDFAMVVPVCAELAAFVDGYRAAVQRAGRLLLIAVLNGRVGAEDSVHALNAECFRELRARFSLREVGQGGWLGRDASMSVLVVDRFTTDRRLPSRQGVGLARKIGADIALELIATGQVRHPFFRDDGRRRTLARGLLRTYRRDRPRVLGRGVSALARAEWARVTWIAPRRFTRSVSGTFNAASSGHTRPMRFTPWAARWWCTPSVTPRFAACPCGGG